MILTGLNLFSCSVHAQTTDNDTTQLELKYKEKYDQFYDSLRYKAQRRNFTRWLHNALIHEPKAAADKQKLTLSYFNPYYFIYRNSGS